MSPEAISRLRHSLRTPLNHIIGYAEMAREDAADRGAVDAAGMMEEICAAARQIVDVVQSGLDAGEVETLRTGILPALDRIVAGIDGFEKSAPEASRDDVAKIRGAARELLEFARAGGGAGAPVRDDARAASPAEEQQAPQGMPGRLSGRILVVDDDPANRDLLCRRLERNGFSAASESSGPDALARLRREPFDLVLLDILMPGMDGFQVLAQMKSQAALRNIPVVVLSALDDVESAVRSIAMGAEDFVTKPFDPVLLRVRIGAILRRREAEAERAELAENLELLLESTGEGVYGVDRQGLCTFVNRAALEMLGYTREELLGRDLHATIHHSRQDGSPYPAAECPTQSVLATGEPRRGSGEALFRSDGSSFPVEYSAHPIRRNGRVEGVVVTFFDISDRKRAEEQLLQSAKLESLGVMAGGIAHDFNNILTGILGNASLVLESLPHSDPNRELLEEVVGASERAADLTRQMLAFAGKGQFVIEPIDLSKAVQEVAELLETSLPKQVRLSMQPARELPPFQGDKRQVQQLTFNLVINAGEAVGERPGRVVVETGARDLPEGAPAEPPFERIPPGRYVYLAVQDTGAGMDEPTRARIFDPFFTTKFTGRGLGLPAALGIARGHHGSIRVESEPGRGSRFEVLFPVTGAGHGATESGAILVADDEEIVRRTTRVVLERKGYRVLLAENGQQAIEVFRQNAADIALVLLDLTMPVMDGEEAVRYLHVIRPEVPILVSSGYSESEVARRFAGRRVQGFVRKPYTSATLLEKIGAALAG